MVETTPAMPTEVVRIGEQYFITVEYDSGPKRLYLDRQTLARIGELITNTLANESPYQRNGKAINSVGRYKRLP